MPLPGKSQLAHEVALTLPGLPAALEGLRIAHLSDLHIDRRHRRLRRVRAEVQAADADLFLLTGDYMNHPGDEGLALEVMGQVVGAMRPRLGILGVFGNHDTGELRRQFAALPVRWLNNEVAVWPGRALEVLGFETDRQRGPDAGQLLERWAAAAERGPAASPVSAGASRDPGGAGPRPLRLLLSHYPLFITAAADMGVDLVLSGHTHGGQIRPWPGRALYNSCDLPLHLSSGILRHRDTLGLISRGLGESWLHLRLFCDPHMPIYTLRRGPLPGRHTWGIANVQPW